jgi:hypothetical protein
MNVKRIAAAVGATAAGLMVLVPVATGSMHVSGMVYAQPVSHVGSTATWEPPTTTTPPAAPLTEKAYPTVKAPHK